LELIDKIQAPADSHRQVLMLSNRSSNQSAIFEFIPNGGKAALRSASPNMTIV
jgi:hypothetical protein